MTRLKSSLDTVKGGDYNLKHIAKQFTQNIRQTDKIKYFESFSRNMTDRMRSNKSLIEYQKEKMKRMGKRQHLKN